MHIRESIQFDGKEISLETGRLARQANGSVLVTYGDTQVLVAVTVQESKEAGDFFPLRVDYEERFYAAGKIPGGFFKREGRPSDLAILSSRLIDRPIRPLFPKEYGDEVQIVATVLSAEPDCSPSIVGILGASAALMISEAPFQGPIAAVKIGRKDGRLVVNPDGASQEEGAVDITVAGTKKTVTMVEGMMSELSEEEVVQAVDLAHAAIQGLVQLQERFAERVRPVKKPVPPLQEDPALRERVHAILAPEFPAIVSLATKKDRHEFVEALRKRVLEAVVSAGLPAEERVKLEKQASALVDEHHKVYMRRRILEQGLRIDGRRPDELRPITGEVGILPRTHGSAVFTRGETQSLGIATLGATRSDEQVIDQMMKEGRKRFMLHYNFPPYSVGEVGRLGSPSRRSIGHGYLAEGALQAVLPSEEQFPYTIRIVSEILESNGSSSMATVCSASLAMMDAGVPIGKPVAGVAMGMIEDEVSKRHVILTDILGAEDHYGDMDFKVAGTKDGVTAFQLDVKVGGIDRETLREALQQAKRARLAILAEMARVIPAPRDHLSPYAPLLETITIPVEKIGLVIGPGGRMIRKIIEETGAEIDIEDDGSVKIAGTDAEGVVAAKKWIEDLTSELEIGTIMETKVTRIVDFGAFVELKNGAEGLVHVSNLGQGYVEKVSDVVKVGDAMTIEVIGVDKMGRPDLRRIPPEGEEAAPPRREGQGQDQGRRGGGSGGGGRRERGEREPARRNGPRSEAPGRAERPARSEPPARPAPKIEAGDIIEGTVSNITDYGAFVDLGGNVTGLVHISALSDDYVKRVEDVVRPGDPITVEVLHVDERGRYKLRRVIPAGQKREPEPAEPEEEEEPAQPQFEDRW
jgi:polyribonucleotide nucleotidyltransferase